MELPQLKHLYFHAPCFDGAASAALLLRVLRKTGRTPKLHPVGYDVRPWWLHRDLPRASAVVDFLYHPAAEFWADHHLSAFIDARHADDVGADHTASNRLYDPAADSCASLLWSAFERELPIDDSPFQELVAWANKIDAARYESAEEAVFGDAPALRISLSLALDTSGRASVRLAQELGVQSLEQICNLPFVSSPYARIAAMRDAGLERFRFGSQELGGVATFDLSVEGVFFSRYAPFIVYPGARYSLGVLRAKAWTKITAMRNPWMEFQSAPLGEIFSHLGGGGHERVGSAFVRESHRAPEVVQCAPRHKSVHPMS